MIAPTLSLPVELSDRIIDYLHDDVRTLLACSIVSRSFCTCSQFHLFHSVTLINQATVTSLTAALTRSPLLARHIRHVHVRADPYKCTAFFALGPFPQVETLDIRRLGTFTISLTLMETTFPNIVSFTIRDTYCKFVSSFFNIIRTFPRVTHLHLYKVAIGPTNWHLALKLPVLALETLILEDCDATPYSALAYVATHLRGVRCVELRCLAGSPPSSILMWGGLLNTLAGTLEELPVVATAWSNPIPDTYFLPNPDLVPLVPQRTLRRLSIHLAADNVLLGPSFVHLVQQVRGLNLCPTAHVMLSTGQTAFCDNQTWDAVISDLVREPIVASCCMIFPQIVVATDDEPSRIARVCDALAAVGIKLLVGEVSMEWWPAMKD